MTQKLSIMFPHSKVRSVFPIGPTAKKLRFLPKGITPQSLYEN